MSKRILVTGGAGFIGSHLVDALLERGNQVMVLDALSFGSDIRNLPGDVKIVGGISGQMVHEIPSGRIVLVVGDVADVKLVQRLVGMTDAVFHLAAQTHVDRSYGDVLPFVSSNIVGSYAVLEAIRSSDPTVRCVFMSTDEVYGDVESGESHEGDPLAPRNIYSALKAGGDLLAQTYAAIFGLDVVIARPANNYGPRQFDEKLMPKIITRFLRIKNGESSLKVPVYGNGSQVRDWLYVQDTAEALLALYDRGVAGEAYNLGAHQFRTVLDVVKAVAPLVGIQWEPHIEYTADRIRGDNRYCLDLSKTSGSIGWSAHTTFSEGLEKTVRWYGK